MKENESINYVKAFKDGYKKGSFDCNIRHLFDTYEDAHWVPVERFGTDGLRPTEFLLCEHDCEGSCVSGSGSSICSNYFGDSLESNHIVCIGKIKIRDCDLFNNDIDEIIDK